MTFRITRHSGFAAPADAFDLLWQRLDANLDGTRFTKVGAGIRATWGGDMPSSIERHEREEIGRRAVFDIVCDVCERAPELKADWFAVSALR
jgi:hypothetical protein